jgi:chromosome partitioning protein
MASLGRMALPVGGRFLLFFWKLEKLVELGKQVQGKFSVVNSCKLSLIAYDANSLQLLITSMASKMNRNFPGIRATLAQEFCGFTGPLKAFKPYFPENVTLAKNEIRFYSASEIRHARLQLAAISKSAANKGETKTKPLHPTLPPIINVRMSKGGTGKTTIAANVSSTLSLMGFKVLMIDADPQASLTNLFGIDWATEEISHIGNLMKAVSKGKTPDISGAVRSIYADGMLDLIASDITLADADSWLMTAPNREAAFKRLLDQNVEWFSQYDAIVVDSAPGTTLLTNTIMFASKTILAVVWLDGQSLRAMEVLSSNITELNQAFSDIGLGIGVHIVANGYHASYQTCKDALQTLQEQFGANLDDNVIPHAAGFMRQMSLYEDADSGPILEREPRSVGARAIIDLTKSLIRKYGIAFSVDDTSLASTTRKVKA